ncbi:Serine/threonine-protein phosphatase 2B catalytic subunit [Cucumispora dikerogammari]|nr:Serine/threonine-protein phosphatase 2B catalytic subunit [Cucumispora dikerogammari]
MKKKEQTKFPYTTHTIPDSIIQNQQTNIFDPNLIRTHFQNQGRLTIEQASKLLSDAKKLFTNEPNLVNIPNKCYIFGDTHGQFYDLINMLSLIDVPNSKSVFVGDYVDRGVFSTETFFYLLVLKLNYPDNIFLLRGNHESRDMTRYFTYLMECEYKYNIKIYEESIAVFDSLPLVAVIDNKIFCVHGGIGPSIKTLKDIQKVNRFVEPTTNPIINELLWSDPHTFYDINDDATFITNYKRGTAYLYGYKGVCEFLKRNNLTTIVRGHEVMENGYELKRAFVESLPSVITIFSAPNYCDVYKNKGAYLLYDDHFFIKQVIGVKHPFVLPGFLNSITWSLPFIAEKLVEIFRCGLQELEIKDSKCKEFETAMCILREETEKLVEIDVDEESEFVTFDTHAIEFEPPALKFEEAKVFDKKNELDVRAVTDENSFQSKESISSKIEEGVITNLSDVKLEKIGPKEVLIEKKNIELKDIDEK